MTCFDDVQEYGLKGTDGLGSLSSSGSFPIRLRFRVRMTARTVNGKNSHRSFDCVAHKAY
jgi:hypothetical protein